MNNGRIVADGLTFDPKRYLPEEKEYSLWPSRIYDLLHAILPGKRLRVSLGLSLTEFLVGLALAASIHFTATYVTTPAVYILSASFGFFMGRARWLTLQVPEQLKRVRLLFDVTDDEFRHKVSSICRSATNRWLTVPLTLLIAALGLIAVADYYFGSDAVVRPHVAALVAPSFPSMWHTGSSLPVKMAILDMYLGLGFLFTIPVLYAASMALIRSYFLVRRWRVVPIPAYVATALQPFSDYAFSSGTYLAIAVAVLAVLYAPRTDAVYVGGIPFLSVLGILAVLVPYLGTRLLINKARQQLGTDVAVSYYRNVWPIANGLIAEPDDPVQERLFPSYAKLLELEQLMHQASERAGLLQQVDYLVRGIAIQLSPTILAIIVVGVSAREQILHVFLR